MRDSSTPNIKDELLSRYHAGERCFAGAELDGTNLDFRNVTLEGADFSRSFVTANFSGAHLRAAVFSNANVKSCDFSDADLRDAVFSEAVLDATTFAGANVEGADFEGAYCYSRTLEPGEKPWW